MKRPNILFIMSDDHAANAVSLYGSRIAKVFGTPNIDRIGKEGALLKCCYCNNSICAPSRATILTGQHSHRNGVRTLRDTLSTELNTFPKILQGSDYQTAIVGKWHLRSQPQGFNYYDILSGQGLYFDPYFKDKDYNWSLCESREKTLGKQYKGYATDIITDKCINWLDTRDRSKPFLLLCHFNAPHEPFEYHPRYEHILDGIEIPEPQSLWEDKSHRSLGSRGFGSSVSEHNPKRNVVGKMSKEDYPTGQLDLTGLDAKGRTRAAYQKYLRDYLRTVKGIDDNVGRLTNYLENEGILDDTIVIYTSDQGMFLGEHDYIDKRWIYEESIRMPLLIRFPGDISPGIQMDDIVTNVDFAPTLLDYTGLEKTDEMQGRSFRSLLGGKTLEDWPNIAYYRYWTHLSSLHNVPAHYGIRTKEYKLIFFYGLPLDINDDSEEPTPAGWEMYDLKKDPEELHNVYSHPDYAGIVKELKNCLLDIKLDIGDSDERYPGLIKRVNET